MGGVKWQPIRGRPNIEDRRFDTPAEPEHADAVDGRRLMTIDREIDVVGRDGDAQNTDRVSGHLRVQVADPAKARLIAQVFDHAEILTFSILGRDGINKAP